MPAGPNRRKGRREAARLLVGFGLLAGVASGCERVSPSISSPSEGFDANPVVLSFVFVGCNRVGWSEDPTGRVRIPPSTANEPQLRRTLADVHALDRPPEFLFLIGDLVRNETSGEVLASQLEAWQSLWDAGPLANGPTRLVPIAGNHEVLRSVRFADDGYMEVPDPGAIEAWCRWLERHGHPPLEPNGPTVADDADDLLAGDGSQLSYSFDARTDDGRSVHFVVLDTDTHSSFRTDERSCYQPPRDDATFDGRTVGGSMGRPVPGWVAANWVRRDLEHHDDADLVFVLGHKPVLWPPDRDPGRDDCDGRDAIFNCGERRLAEELRDTLVGSGSVVAYLAAHQHRWDLSTIDGGLVQVVAGNGGSPLDDGVPAEFGFTLVEIHRDGLVVATPHVRPVPTPYDGPDGVVPARPASPVVLREATRSAAGRPTDQVPPRTRRSSSSTNWSR